MASKEKETFVKVVALQTGYYGEERRYEGEQFVMKRKDFIYHDKAGKPIIEKVEDEESGEMFDAYKTCSWVDLVQDNFDPEKEVVKTVAKKKVRIGPAEPVSEAPKPLSNSSNPNPEGFAKGGMPAKATDLPEIIKKGQTQAPAPTRVKADEPKDDVI